jgi:hypothetical protein
VVAAAGEHDDGVELADAADLGGRDLLALAGLDSALGVLHEHERLVARVGLAAVDLDVRDSVVVVVDDGRR